MSDKKPNIEQASLIVDDLDYFLNKYDSMSEDQRMNYIIGVAAKYRMMFDDIMAPEIGRDHTVLGIDRIDYRQSQELAKTITDNLFDLTADRAHPVHRIEFKTYNQNGKEMANGGMNKEAFAEFVTKTIAEYVHVY